MRRGLCLLLALLSVTTGCREESPPASPPGATSRGEPVALNTVTDPQLVELWLTSLERIAWPGGMGTEEYQRVLQAAGDLCGAISASPPEPWLVALCRDNGVSEVFITAPFNRYDRQLWLDAVAMRDRALKIRGDLDGVPGLQALFDAVRERVEPVEPDSDPILWPTNVWALGKGVCDRQCWLLCELAYQSGWDTQIVYLMDEETGESPHTICELRMADAVCVADPLFGYFLPGVSVADLARDADRCRAMWPEKAGWPEAVKAARFWLPAYPQDYCPRNQVLQRRLVEAFGDEVPRFGEKPEERMRRHGMATSRGDRIFEYDFWFYPFRLLKEQIRRRKASRPASE